MTEASAYIIEEIQESLEAANKLLESHSRKSKRAISAKKDLDNYEKGLESVLKRIENTLDEYPDDTEFRKMSERFNSLYTDRHKNDVSAQLEKVSHLISDLKSMVHWRKMETSYGKSLGFSDFRSLRGESKKR